MTYTRRKRTQRVLRDPLEHLMAAGAWPGALAGTAPPADPVRFAAEMADDADRFAAGYRAALAGEPAPWWAGREPEVWEWMLAAWEEEARQWRHLQAVAEAGADPLPPFDYAAVRGAKDAAQASQTLRKAREPPVALSHGLRPS